MTGSSPHPTAHGPVRGSSSCRERKEVDGSVEAERPRDVAADEQTTEGAAETHGDRPVRRELGVVRLKRIEHRENPLGADSRSHAGCIQCGFHSAYSAVVAAALNPTRHRKRGDQHGRNHGRSSTGTHAMTSPDGLQRFRPKPAQNLRWWMLGLAIGAGKLYH